LKVVGRNPLSGKKKGGIKAHVLINAQENTPILVRYSSAARHDNKQYARFGDEEIFLTFKENKEEKKLRTRRITYYDKDRDKTLVFITNSFEFDAETIALIYKKRWQIETLFKQLKQNFPLKYFLGDNQNAIERRSPHDYLKKEY